jgi:hypothetical protein
VHALGKDHHKGVATLVNSLVRMGYRAGYRGDLPPWAVGGAANGDVYTFAVGVEVEVVFIKIQSDLHFAQVKPTWMLRVLEEFEPGAEGVYYFDPDMFVVGPWAFFERWLKFDIAACEDVAHPFNPCHPLVLGWQQYAKSIGYTHWNEANARRIRGKCRGWRPSWRNSVLSAIQHSLLGSTSPLRGGAEAIAVTLIPISDLIQ